MKTVRQLTENILRHEGGFVNDPDDPGGATNYGVTIHTMRRLGFDLDRDGNVDEADVRALTIAQAAEIFERDYFRRPKIDRLPAPLQASVYDMSVNAGSMSVKLLQRLSTSMGFPCEADGVIGPKTLSAVEAAFASAPGFMPDAYGIERRNYYYRLGDRRPQLRKFARRRDGGKGGWITRAESFIAPRYHLTTAEHRERVSQWA